MLRLLTALLFCITAVAASAQQAEDPDASTVLTSPAVSTLEDILRRQEALQTNDGATRAADIGDPANAMPATDQLGTLGGASDADLWRAYRFDAADLTTQFRGPAATTLMQDSGMWWVLFRDGPLLKYGSYLLGGTLGLLALFYLLRGRIRLDHPPSGQRITRFKAVERFAHWLLATSFIVLGITGLISLFGRKVLIPAFGHEAFSIIAIGSKWVHDNISWAFMLSLVMIFVFWVVHNLPDRTDIKWILKAGGMFGGGHPPAKKFNAGQKLVFWSVIVFGGSISASGLSLLFPFELHLFAHTFALLNDLGVPGWFGRPDLPVDLTPHAEMQYAQLWHSIMALVLTAVILGHIYIGTLGMEGAFDAMGSGEVDTEWAKAHHALWADEVISKQDQTKAASS